MASVVNTTRSEWVSKAYLRHRGPTASGEIPRRIPNSCGVGKSAKRCGMNDEEKTREQLIEELVDLRQRVASQGG